MPNNVNITIEIAILLLSIVNIIAISISIYKKKYSLAWTLAFIQAIVIGGFTII